MDAPLDPIAIVAGIALAVFLFVLLLASVLTKLQRFRSELSYINMELRRASAKERKHWRRRRRRLWLSLLPFTR